MNTSLTLCYSCCRLAYTSSSSAASVSTTTRARGTGSTATASVYEVLLDWADTAAAEPHERPVKVQEHPQYGRCLVAVEDIPNGTVLLSVPLEQVFQSQVCERWLAGSCLNACAGLDVTWKATVNAALLLADNRR